MLPSARKHNLMIESVGNDLLIYNCLTNEGITLNKTAALIWRKCDGMKSPWQIQKELCSELNAVISEEIVWLALAQFRDKGLLIDQLDQEYNANNESSRKIQAA